ncbi:MAG: M48 family metallopeptidase [Thermodesulfovibrionales bacterium]
MTIENLRIGILFLYLLKEAFEYLVQGLNINHMRRSGTKLPSEFEGKVDKETLKRMQDYEADKTYFNIYSSLFGNIVTIAFFFGGLLNIYNTWITSLNLPFLISGWIFFVILIFAATFLEVPFNLFYTFRIENRYGFNTTTFGLWISDFLKSLIITLILSSIIIIAGLYLLRLSPNYWWLLIWGFLFFFGLFIMYISPYVIEPLFNKFTPIEDESLKEKISYLAERAGIHIGRILRVDASRRSRHTNAYFTGIGKTKRIVLYDTLLKSMSNEEILAVLAHEIGHWKRKHLLKTLFAFETLSLIAIYVSFRLIEGDFILRLFHIDTDTVFVKFAVLAFIGGILSLPLQVTFNYFSRRYEREADRVSYDLTKDPQNMISALVKLSEENLSNLYPHPLYVLLYYSHPPISERIRRIGNRDRANKRAG